MPKVSICIPVYKDLTGLQRLINSIQKQSFSDFEVVITDDTPDETVETYIKDNFENGLCLNDNHFVALNYYHNRPSLGPAGNWNYSIDMASGEYIKIMHQDDFFTFENSLFSFVKLLDDSPAAALAFSGSRQVTLKTQDPTDVSNFYDRHINDEHLQLISKDWRNLFLGGYIGAPSAVIYRKSDKHFDAELSWLIDSDFYMNLLKEGSDFAMSQEPLVSIGVSENQLTNSCISSKEINIREHKHLYLKYNLGFSQTYQEKLADVVIEYKGKYSDISDTGLSKEIFENRLSAYKKEKALFYRNLILRKLHLKKD